MRYLCLDPGLSKTGTAISYEGKLVSPLLTFSSPSLNTIVDKTVRLCRDYQIDVLIIGQPQNGSIHSLANSLFISLQDLLEIPIYLQPEDLSSIIGTRKLASSSMSRTKREVSRHASAAAIILEEYLESL